MSSRRGLWRFTAATVAILGTVALSPSIALGAPRHGATHRPDHLSKLISPAKKYYGMFVSQAPASMAPINKVTQETGKQPNMSLFYRAWDSAAAAGTSNIPVGGIANACNAGMLPMLTWESWDTNVTQSDGAPAWSQPDFSPATIANGTYDAYIRSSAQQIKNLDCPIALRLDQEQNGYWYPWGITTQGMNNSAADYAAMWRHIWTIFNQVGVQNVLWVWSPDIQSHKHTGLPDLSASYPGNRYVDWIGIDGYLYNNPHETFYEKFQPTFDQLRTFVAHKPWIVAECGVGTGARKPQQIKNVLSAVARRKRLIGMNYFDTNKATDHSNWTFDETQSSLDAFKNAIQNPMYATGVPGDSPGE
jgi:hypothetical protein